MTQDLSDPTQADEPLVPLTREGDLPAQVAAEGLAPAVPATTEFDDPFEADAEESPATYVCNTCGGNFSADRVYDAGGSFICAECFMRQPPADVRRTASAPGPSPAQPPVSARGRLLLRATCPHCWHRFPPDQVLWISRHVDLLGDPVLGPESASRFLPSRFNADGDAIDARGMACNALACPRCHLSVPRAVLESDPLFASIIGVSGSGKSYFVTAMTWELRRLMPRYLGVAFGDTDAVINQTINRFEETLFLQDDPSRPVQLEKTDVAGAQWYDQIRLGQQIVNLPKPFLFTMSPLRGHPQAGAEDAARLICLYDNAGEHFDPGQDAASSPVTQHLSRSRVIMFLYDPTQDPRFRAALRGRSADPQLDERSTSRRQETILTEAASRLRRFAGLAPHEPNRRPLIVVVPKADVWGGLMGLDLSTEPMLAGAGADGRLAAVDTARVEQTSALVRDWLAIRAPEFVAAADAFSSHVLYVPVSALGCSPQVRDGREGLWVVPRDLRPRWVTVPVLYMLAKWSHGLIDRARVTVRPA